MGYMPEGREGPPRQEMEDLTASAREQFLKDKEGREGWKREERDLSLDQYAVAADLLRRETDPYGYGQDLLTMWFSSQIGTHGGTEISSWSMSSILAAMGTRYMEEGFLRVSREKVSLALNKYAENLTGAEREEEENKTLTGAIVKSSLYNRVGDEDIKKSLELTEDEEFALRDYRKEFKDIDLRCSKCGDFGKVLKEEVEARKKVIETQVLLDSPLLEDILGNGEVEKIKAEFSAAKEREVRASKKVQLEQKYIDREGKSEATRWVKLTKAFMGVSSVFNGCNQWLTNQSDLEPIGRMWESQGRMVEIHPDNLIDMVERYPSFEVAFRAIAAVGSGKYALDLENGKIYPSGKYNMGYVDGRGNIVDVDEGKRLRITPLTESQIWVDGKVVEVNSDGKAMIGNKLVEIYNKNILYVEGVLKDSDINNYLDKITRFTSAADKNSGELDIGLAVELARNFYEMSMLSNWNGVSRDSQGKPYYAEYKQENYDSGSNPKRTPNYLTISSDPESKAVKFGMPAYGWDEASLFPYWVNDWGKLTLTRFKQSNELWKGRKHGLYALLPNLPESLVKPLLSNDSIKGIINGDIKMVNLFEGMRSVERFKTFWLDIAKGIAVYEFVSSYFIGDKDVTKAEQDLLGMMMNPRNFEGLNKNIDLSLLYVDKWEAARLKVNIVTAALASVAKGLRLREFVGLAPQGSKEGRLEIFLSEIKRNSVASIDNLKDVEMALRQLVVSRFVGGEDEVMKILSKIVKFEDVKEVDGEDLCFTMKEFKSVFGADYLEKVWRTREDRRNKVNKVGKPKN